MNTVVEPKGREGALRLRERHICRLRGEAERDGSRNREDL